nr:hypothetical protein [Tanacetum cinerariifolium]
MIRPKYLRFNPDMHSKILARQENVSRMINKDLVKESLVSTHGENVGEKEESDQVEDGSGWSWKVLLQYLFVVILLILTIVPICVMSCQRFHILKLDTKVTLMDENLRQVITGSWDKTLKCWNPRGASVQECALVGTYAQPELVYSISLVGNRVVVATAKRYPLSSMEGRVAIEFFELTEASQSKSHRKSEDGRDIVYLVNAIAFNPVWGTFATCGYDGFWNGWDGNNKKRLYHVISTLCP